MAQICQRFNFFAFLAFCKNLIRSFQRGSIRLTTHPRQMRGEINIEPKIIKKDKTRQNKENFKIKRKLLILPTRYFVFYFPFSYQVNRISPMIGGATPVGGLLSIVWLTTIGLALSGTPSFTTKPRRWEFQSSNKTKPFLFAGDRQS